MECVTEFKMNFCIPRIQCHFDAHKLKDVIHVRALSESHMDVKNLIILGQHLFFPKRKTCR